MLLEKETLQQTSNDSVLKLIGRKRNYSQFFPRALHLPWFTSDEKFRKVDNYGAGRGMQWRHPRLVAAREPSSDPSGKI